MDEDMAIISSLEDRFGVFRGNYAETAALKNAVDIAILLDEDRGIGLEETSVRVLSVDDLRALARGYGTDRLADIPLDARRSYYRADLVMEVNRLGGSRCYIAVEASYTCNRRTTDRTTDRAISNADLLAEFTGLDAWPVIAGVRVDRNIRPLIDSDEVFWYRLEEVDMEPSEPS